MTQEEKARAYDEALERAKFYYENCPSEPEKKKLEEMFPKLREGEDERIRKALIELLKEVEEDETYTGRQHISEMLAYLEKQKEQKSLNLSAASEWLRKNVCHYMNSEYNEFHKCVEYDGSIDKEKLINDFEEAMQKELNPAVWNKATINGEPIPTENKTVDIPLPEWSEEDETHRDFILESLEDQTRFCKKDAEGAYYAKQIRTAQNWLISLTSNLKKKNEDVAKLCSNEWSKEDEEMLVRLLDSISIGNDYKEMCNWLLPKLKSFRPQSHWSPSKEQMEALEKAMVRSCGHQYGVPLSELYEQLKKL